MELFSITICNFCVSWSTFDASTKCLYCTMQHNVNAWSKFLYLLAGTHKIKTVFPKRGFLYSSVYNEHKPTLRYLFTQMFKPRSIRVICSCGSVRASDINRSQIWHSVTCIGPIAGNNDRREQVEYWIYDMLIDGWWVVNSANIYYCLVAHKNRHCLT